MNTKAKRIALFANGPVAVKVAKSIRESQDEILMLFLHQPEKQSCVDELIAETGLASDKIHVFDKEKSSHYGKLLEKLDLDFIITIYWAHLIKAEIFTQARHTVNFHISPLPINRGWYPHVHSFIDGSPFGVSLHVIEEGADTGPIWAQTIVEADETDTAGEIYKKLEESILQLFIANWQKIKSGEIEAKAQDETKANYKSIKDIEGLDHIDLEKSYKAKDFINLLKARSFNNKGFAYYLNDKGEKTFLQIKLSKTSTFQK